MLRTTWTGSLIAPSQIGRERSRHAAFATLSVANLLVVLWLGLGHQPAWADPAAQAAWRIKHAPYLQLGNAPLVGLPGSETDQIEILWQTVPAGDAAGLAGGEAFRADYRAAGAAEWIDTDAPATIDTGVEGRVNHSVVIKGLTYNTEYQYRVRHLLGDQALATYENTFHTRLAAGDPAPFTFVAYGDSAGEGSLENFVAVQKRINALNPAFALLLGDNVYDSGSHREFDTRLDPAANPAASQFIAGHIDYFAMGNHDIGKAKGQASRDNYSVPVPEQGVTSPVPGPKKETPEHNYSFDYGCAHFVTFDSNSFTNPSRLAEQLEWVVADSKASNARWKIVFPHHPVGSLADHPEHRPGTNYYRQVVARLREAGADLLLVGHAHTYQRSYPLLGEQDGKALFVHDTDNHYEEGAGLPQVVAGMGGRSLRKATIPTDSYVAKGYTANSNPPCEYGCLKVDVTPGRLTLTYVAADDGAALDQFTIERPATTSGPAAEAAGPE